MPDWVLNVVLPMVLPIITRALTEALKNLYELLKDKMPGPVVVSVAGVVGEGVNQVQGLLTGVALPYGLSGLLAVLLNETRDWWQNAAGQHPGGI